MQMHAYNSTYMQMHNTTAEKSNKFISSHIQIYIWINECTVYSAPNKYGVYPMCLSNPRENRIQMNLQKSSPIFLPFSVWQPASENS